MPGAIPHLIVAITMIVIGRYYFKNYFNKSEKIKKLLILAIVCLIFGFIPDFFLIIYYTTHVFSFCEILPFHNFILTISGPVAIIGLLILIFKVDIKTKPIWIMGMWCILLHVILDLFIPDTSIWI
jgi:hypothetical protein